MIFSMFLKMKGVRYRVEHMSEDMRKTTFSFVIAMDRIASIGGGFKNHLLEQ